MPLEWHATITPHDQEESTVVSEYQYYEFQAIDRPLSERQIGELRKLSTRADITSTSFTNEYQWGDFRGDPRRMMEKYFDAFLYYANWGTHWLMLRLPQKLIDLKLAKRYCGGQSASIRAKGDYAIVEFHSDNDDGHDFGDELPSLASLVPLRSEIVAGDLRSLYLGWLLRVQNGESGERAPEPPTPPGLLKLTGAQRALADFLRIDDDLLRAAAQVSTGDTGKQPTTRERKAWLAKLPESEKNSLVMRVMEGEGLSLTTELQQRFTRDWRKAHPAEKATARTRRRTASELRAAAEATARKQ